MAIAGSSNTNKRIYSEKSNPKKTTVGPDPAPPSASTRRATRSDRSVSPLKTDMLPAFTRSFSRQERPIIPAGDRLVKTEDRTGLPQHVVDIVKVKTEKVESAETGHLHQTHQFQQAHPGQTKREMASNSIDAIIARAMLIIDEKPPKEEDPAWNPIPIVIQDGNLVGNKPIGGVCVLPHHNVGHVEFHFKIDHPTIVGARCKRRPIHGASYEVRGLEINDILYLVLFDECDNRAGHVWKKEHASDEEIMVHYLQTGHRIWGTALLFDLPNGFMGNQEDYKGVLEWKPLC